MMQTEEIKTNSPHKLDITCPFCRTQHHYSTSATGHPLRPKAGDFTICMTCGEWGAFDDRCALRKPTDAEYEKLATDEDAIRARNAWVKVDEERRREKEQQDKAKKLPHPDREKLSAMLDQGFDQIFKGMFCDRPMPPAAERTLRRVFMGGVLVCYERMSRIADMEDEEGARHWAKVKAEIAEFCADTIVSLATTKE